MVTGLWNSKPSQILKWLQLWFVQRFSRQHSSPEWGSFYKIRVSRIFIYFFEQQQPHTLHIFYNFLCFCYFFTLSKARWKGTSLNKLIQTYRKAKSINSSLLLQFDWEIWKDIQNRLPFFDVHPPISHYKYLIHMT